MKHVTRSLAHGITTSINSQNKLHVLSLKKISFYVILISNKAFGLTDKVYKFSYDVTRDQSLSRWTFELENKRL